MGVTVKPKSLESQAASDGLVQLARELVGLAVAERHADGDRELLDIEVNGVRCILTRVHEPDSVGLSPREQEIARLVAQGYPNKTIASVLEISTWTVSTHLRRIFAKLDVHTRASMIARLVEDGRRQPPSGSASSSSSGARRVRPVERSRRWKGIDSRAL